jgi:hypothetical protein
MSSRTISDAARRLSRSINDDWGTVLCFQAHWRPCALQWQPGALSIKTVLSWNKFRSVTQRADGIIRHTGSQAHSAEHSPHSEHVQVRNTTSGWHYPPHWQHRRTQHETVLTRNILRSVTACRQAKADDFQ